MRTDKVANEPFKKLIMICLGVSEITDGCLSSFATVYSDFSKKKISRVTVHQWLYGKGVPADKCGIAKKLSIKYAKTSSEFMDIEEIRPDLFG